MGLGESEPGRRMMVLLLGNQYTSQKLENPVHTRTSKVRQEKRLIFQNDGTAI